MEKKKILKINVPKLMKAGMSTLKWAKLTKDPKDPIVSCNQPKITKLAKINFKKC